jgi:hypothetical protein
VRRSVGPVSHPLRELYDAAVERDTLPLEAESLRRRYSYGLPTDEALALLVEHSPLIEIGAGLGYWAKLATQAGASVSAFDVAVAVAADQVGSGNNEYTQGTAHFGVLPGGPEVLAGHPSHTLFLCWPPRDSTMASDCLSRYSGEVLIYAGPVGEHARNAGDERFHATLSQAWRVERTLALPRWPEPELQADLRLLRRCR